jgi:hypothetical protein
VTVELAAACLVNGYSMPGLGLTADEAAQALRPADTVKEVGTITKDQSVSAVEAVLSHRNEPPPVSPEHRPTPPPSVFVQTGASSEQWSMQFTIRRDGASDPLIRAYVEVESGAGSAKSSSIVQHGFDEHQLRAVAAQIESLMSKLPAKWGGASHTERQSLSQSTNQAANAIAKALGFLN